MRLTLFRAQYDGIIGNGEQWDTMLTDGGLERLLVLQHSLELKVDRVRKAFIKDKVGSWRLWVDHATERGGRQAHTCMKESVGHAQLETEFGPLSGMGAIGYIEI